MSTKTDNYQQYLERERGRKRKNRKQLCFTEEELELIDKNMKELNITNFSLYIRATACYSSIKKEKLEEIKEKLL